MTAPIQDIHIAQTEPLPEPRLLREAFPVTDAEAAFIAAARHATRAILKGQDDRLLVIVGPCSVHEPESALEYAGRLRELAKPGLQKDLLVVMRVYFEKPRTRMGWKGPDL